MTIRWLSLIGFVAVGFLAPPSARAQESESEIVYKKHTVVEFGDDTIEGDLSRPDGQYIDARKRQRHRNLIRVRESFRDEILRSILIL